MTIMRIEGLTYGVEDVAECTRFLDDAGFLPDDQYAGEGVQFRTRANQFMRMVPLDTKAYPPAIEAGSTLRQVSWGVDNDEGLEEISRALGVARNADGTITTVDPMGMGLEFRIVDSKPLDLVPTKYNMSTAVSRRNDTVQLKYEARPLRIAHAGCDLELAKREETRDFYINKLKFKPTEDLLQIGVFLQCEGDTEHHQWFVFHRANKFGYNHFAVEAGDFDSVVLSGEHLLKKGWKEARRLGRHLIGSNIFRFFHVPFGGRMEFTADMDHIDKDFPTKIVENRPSHHLWLVRGSEEH